ncbi:Trans-aconitate 2-methyltransferase [Austwickia sp. TVS 96-490-7B]|uniref:class I SAM-dependent methyltransferase n=1 Tax=Austwickia sp. TVS 96-490-7B TaxID=2830843 RepID=UPI001C57BC41|nr:class I SAM-dependent methyltransferase [Austwickia sp. TVS 96-490-7B]MBW3086197.1 Trans-aconitate 2-methyltransferase [Austwickia sp. TVS 96-490-7B]
MTTPMNADWQMLARESYDRVAQSYAQMTRSAPMDNAAMAGDYAMLTELAARTISDGVATIVDIGCGPGWWTQFLAARGVQVMGVDLSPVMIDIARENVPQARFEMGSVLDIPVPSESADGVCCMYVLHHLPDAELGRAVSELARILTPGGVLLLGGHIGATHSVKTQGYGGHPMHVHVNKRSAATWEQVVHQKGLRIESHAIYDLDTSSLTHALLARKPNALTI